MYNHPSGWCLVSVVPPQSTSLLFFFFFLSRSCAASRSRTPLLITTHSLAPFSITRGTADSNCQRRTPAAPPVTSPPKPSRTGITGVLPTQFGPGKRRSLCGLHDKPKPSTQTPRLSFPFCLPFCPRRWLFVLCPLISLRSPTNDPEWSSTIAPLSPPNCRFEPVLSVDARDTTLIHTPLRRVDPTTTAI
ncbi:hypothetical protein GQ53DRAFT_21793 [Thozetella sp. PMI_491]|nr:hypothetical protein GQ53DRAFT_21793 [Thozetella sp. PMI_491]